jgi:hypothetical protein
VVSGAQLRGFGFPHSWFQVQYFVVSGTGATKLLRAIRGFREVIHTVTLLNTDSNLHNTGQRQKMDDRLVYVKKQRSMAAGRQQWSVQLSRFVLTVEYRKSDS